MVEDVSMGGAAETWEARALRLGEFFRGRGKRLTVSLPKEGTIGIACSGGADSLTLLLLVWQEYEEVRRRMCVLHMNHGLRGEASDGDEIFVREVAEALGLPVLRSQGRAKSENGDCVSEAMLREERLAFFRNSGVAAVLQGHHGGDVLETMLMRLCRGSGTEGLSAPVPDRKLGDGLRLLRPLLDWGRDDIREGLRSSGIPWREDASNAGSVYLRNRVRNRVIPVLREASTEHDPMQGALRSRRLLEEDAAALTFWAEQVADGLPESGVPWAVPVALPRGLLRRVLRVWLEREGVANTAATTWDELLDALRDGKDMRLSVADGKQLCLQGGVLSVCSVEREEVFMGRAVLVPGAHVHLPTGGVLSTKLVSMEGELRDRVLKGKVDPAHEAYLAWQGEDSSCAMQVRFREPGDRYRPLGAPGTRKLKDVFIDAKIPLRERSRIPVVCLFRPQLSDHRDAAACAGDYAVREKILWLPGFPPSECHRVQPDTRWALGLTWSSGVENIQF